MNKKGFTLVELLTVIIILGIIAVITSPVIINVINESKDQANDHQITLIKNAAERWGVDNLKKLPTTSDKICCITTETLLNGGYISRAEINDPTKNTVSGAAIEITYNPINKQYIYTYKTNVSSCNCD